MMATDENASGRLAPSARGSRHAYGTAAPPCHTGASNARVSVPNHIHESIDAIVDLQAQERVGKHQRGIEHVVDLFGRPRSLYGLCAFIGLWVGTNLALLLAGHPAFDRPPFQVLQTIMSIAALLVTTMVLIAENRQTHAEARRGALDLQINLLAEKKAAKIIELLETLRRDMPSVPNRVDREAKEMSSALDPRLVAEALDQSIDDADARKKP
jgi:uncharacterized membrane protein